MRVTLICDASFCPDTKCMGYGYWVASSRQKKPGAGHLDNIENSTDAEMHAIMHSLRDCLSEGTIKDGDYVLIQSDCVPAIARFIRTTKHSYTTILFQTLVKHHRLEVEFRHLPGHGNDGTPKTSASNHCDRRAKIEMRKFREKKLCDAKVKEIFNDQADASNGRPHEQTVLPFASTTEDRWGARSEFRRNSDGS